MTIKYKLAFTIDSETLFGIMSKFLPIQDLSVEEIVERPPQLNDGPRFDKQFDLPKRAKQVRRKKGNGYALNPYAGCNAVFLMFLRDGMPHAFADAIPAIKAAGYSPSGMYGRIERLLRHGYIERIAKGRYQLTHKGKAAWNERPHELDAALSNVGAL